MHTRRVAAFLIGGWLLGSLLVAFVSSQSVANVDRFFSSRPPQIAKQVDEAGGEVLRQILRYQADQHIRHVSETWQVIQLGLGSALLATAFLTSHRSRIVLMCSLVMTLIAAVSYLYFTPAMNALARSFDFLPVTAAVKQRESFIRYSVWFQELEIVKILLGLVITGRLLVDRHEWRHKSSTPLNSLYARPEY
jgi:hypothetical protein